MQNLKQIHMDKIIEIKQKRSLLFIFIILLLVSFVAPYCYSFYSSEELSLLLHLILILLIVFLAISFIDGYFMRISLTNNAIIKKSLLINKVIKLDETKELHVYNKYISIIAKNNSFNIGWDYEKTQEFKVLLIQELEKRNTPILYKNKWWEQ